MDTVEIRKEDNAVILHSCKALYVVYPNELVQLVKNDENTLFKALKRGKSEKRYRANERRNG